MEIPDGIEGDLEVGPGCVVVGQVSRFEGTLTIAPGTTVKMLPDAHLHFLAEGVLKANGTEDEPIVFRSSLEDGAPGDWQCVYIEGGPESELQHVVFEHGGATCTANGGNYTSSVIVDTAVRRLEDVTVRDGSGHGLLLLEESLNSKNVRRLHFENVEGPSLKAHPNALDAVTAPIEWDDDDTHVEVENRYANATVTWRNLGLPLRVEGEIDVSDLTIEPGVVLQVGSMELGLGDRLMARGTAEEPIVWTSSSDDPVPGDWGCLNMPSGMAVLEHNVFEFAGGGCGGGNTPVAIELGGTGTFRNLVFRDLPGAAISASCDETESAWCDFTYDRVPESVWCGYDNEPVCGQN